MKNTLAHKQWTAHTIAGASQPRGCSGCSESANTEFAAEAQGFQFADSEEFAGTRVATTLGSEPTMTFANEVFRSDVWPPWVAFASPQEEPKERKKKKKKRKPPLEKVHDPPGNLWSKDPHILLLEMKEELRKLDVKTKHLDWIKEHRTRLLEDEDCVGMCSGTSPVVTGSKPKLRNAGGAALTAGQVSSYRKEVKDDAIAKAVAAATEVASEEVCHAEGEDCNCIGNVYPFFVGSLNCTLEYAYYSANGTLYSDAGVGTRDTKRTSWGYTVYKKVKSIVCTQDAIAYMLGACVEE